MTGCTTDQAADEAVVQLTDGRNEYAAPIPTRES